MENEYKTTKGIRVQIISLIYKLGAFLSYISRVKNAGVDHIGNIYLLPQLKSRLFSLLLPHFKKKKTAVIGFCSPLLDINSQNASVYVCSSCIMIAVACACLCVFMRELQKHILFVQPMLQRVKDFKTSQNNTLQSMG